MDDGHSAELAEHVGGVDRTDWPRILLAMEVVEALLIGILDEVGRGAH